MQSLLNLIQAWRPHPYVDHFTVALVIIAVLTDLVASLFPSRAWMRYMALTLMILGAAAAFASDVTGGWEARRVYRELSGPAKSVLHTHAELGGILPWLFLGLAVWRLGIQFVGFIGATRPLYLLIAVASMVAIFIQGRLGGQLVYTYGVGTDVMPAAGQTISVSPSPAATAGIATALPTVFVPTPTPAASAAPSPAASASPEPSPSATLSVGATNPSATPSATVSPIASPAAATTPVAPVNPGASMAPSPSPASSSTAHSANL